MVLPTDGRQEEGTAARLTAWLLGGFPHAHFVVQFRNDYSTCRAMGAFYLLGLRAGGSHDS